jgi:hypothetical protein
MMNAATIALDSISTIPLHGTGPLGMVIHTILAWDLAIRTATLAMV